MAEFELIMPKMGESVAEATITKWLKNEGETIDLEESVLEIATDKVDSEVPAPVEGILKKKLFNVDDVVQVGTAIAIIETEAAGSVSAATNGSAENAAKEEAVKKAEAVVETASQTTSDEKIPARTEDGKFYSPLVRSIAQEEGVSLSELDSIEGSGSEGRVTKKDILSYIESRGKAPAKTPETPAPSAQPAPAKPKPAVKTLPPVTMRPGDEIIEMAETIIASTRLSAMLPT
jgi:2-oxoglutarate dehydrogenase E2 component (dihydrolipoamide succinyltransferase)